ncbi:MAG: hypothetical protein M3067_05525 [Chloroflexota bacterium]|nr:hypothetical protein [Chloroflexota bacterium]
MRRLGSAFGATLVSIAVLTLTAGPMAACGGLIGPNGAVNLLRTTTLAGYHDGVEHYITAFQFAGGGGKFGSITPFPASRPASRRVATGPSSGSSARPARSARTCSGRLFPPPAARKSS